MMKNKSLLVVLLLILLWSCQDSLTHGENDANQISITLKTSNKKDVATFLKNRAMKRSNSLLFKAYPQFMKEIPLEGTNAKITSTPVVLKK